MTLGKSLNLSGAHLWIRNLRGVLRIKWTDCASSTRHIVGSHYVAATSRQIEVYYSRNSGESQNPRIRMLDWEEIDHRCLWQARAWYFYSKLYTWGWELNHKAVRLGVWFNVQYLDRLKERPPQVSTARRGVGMPGGRGRETLGRLLAGDGGLPRAVARMWGILLAAGEASGKLFFFFLRF